MRASLLDLRSAITSAINELSTEDLSRRDEGKWSVAEILEHLNLTYIGTAKGLRRCLESGQAAAGSNRIKRLPQRLGVIWAGYFPPGRKSPERVLPRGTPPEQVRREILQNLARLEQAIADCETKFGKSKPIVDHPLLGPLTASEWRKFHVVHGKHHLKQITRLRRSS